MVGILDPAAGGHVIEVKIVRVAAQGQTSEHAGLSLGAADVALGAELA
jgi:hypothetical protein